MELATTHRQPPAWSTVLSRQLVLLLRANRVLQIAVLALALLLASELFSRGLQSAQAISMSALMFFFNWLWLVGLAWGLMIWSDEGPARRSYHAGLPVDRALHDATRVIAGAIWLAGVTAAILATGVLLGAIRGQLAELGSLTAAAWLNYFTAPLQMYLLLAIFSVALNRPLQWFLGAVAVFLASMLAASQYGIGFWRTAGDFVARSFAAAMNDGFIYGQPAMQEVLQVQARTGSVEMVEAFRESGALPPEQWALALAAWLIVLSAGIWAAAARRPIG